MRLGSLLAANSVRHELSEVSLTCLQGCLERSMSVDSQSSELVHHKPLGAAQDMRSHPDAVKDILGDGLSRYEADFKSAQAVKRDAGITVEQVVVQAISNGSLSRVEAEAAIPRMLFNVRTSPIHIGFRCHAGYFNKAKEFFPDGQIYARAAKETLHPPVYGALNFTMQGHVGWGASSFVLKPHVLAQAEIRSRDTGEPDGIGMFARYGHEHQLLPLLWDWAKMGMFKEIAQAWQYDDRQVFAASAPKPLEVAIFTEKGALSAADIAMLFVAENELEKPELKTVIQHRCSDLELPVFFHRYQEGKIPFQSYPEYVDLMNQYQERAQEI